MKVPPKAVNGTLVHVAGAVAMIRGEEWVTLAPEDEGDDRLWEFSLKTGRIVQTLGVQP